MRPGRPSSSGDSRGSHHAPAEAGAARQVGGVIDVAQGGDEADPTGRRGWPACRRARARSTSAHWQMAAVSVAGGGPRPASSRRRWHGRTRSRRGRARGTPATIWAGVMPGMSVPMITTGPGALDRGCAACGGRDRLALVTRAAGRAASAGSSSGVGRNPQRGLPAWIETDPGDQGCRAVARKARRRGNADLACQPRLDGAGHRRLGHDDEPATKRRRATARRLLWLSRPQVQRPASRRRRQAAFTGSNT